MRLYVAVAPKKYVRYNVANAPSSTGSSTNIDDSMEYADNAGIGSWAALSPEGMIAIIVMYTESSVY